MKIKWVERGVCFPDGFLSSGVACGIKRGEPDLGILFSKDPCNAAGVFTTNRVKAAPVVVSMDRLKSSDTFRAVVVNSGNANCCTGNKGIRDAKEMCKITAQHLNIGEEEVLVCSTGVIGEPLPMERVRRGIQEAAALLEEDDTAFSQAILTTDTRPKKIAVEAQIDGFSFKIGGCAKGAGMIYPNMATMLSFITTDAEVPQDELSDMLREAVSLSFNRISVDGDRSTNDTVLILSKRGRELPASLSGEFFKLLVRVCESLALMIVSDGEGATKVVKVEVVNASSPQEAESAARQVAGSLLFRTAIFGEDPNWGRIMGAVGASGACFDPDRVDIYFDSVKIVSCGISAGEEAERRAREVMKRERFKVTIDLKAGNSSYHMWCCDITCNYVKINADYRS